MFLDSYNLQRTLLVVLIISSSTLAFQCELRDIVSNCQYTILCHGGAGRSDLRSCSGHGVNNVTFFITDSTISNINLNHFGTTNFDGNVRYLKLRNSTWNTLYTNAFKYYLHTVSIDFSGNNIERIMTETFGHLSELQNLNLSSNWITTIDPRAFKIIEAGSNIETLDLSHNKLKAIEEQTFNSLVKLKNLFLQNNMLRLIDDSAFMIPKNLINLHLENNFINSLDMCLVYLKMLTNLDMSNNLLNKLSSVEFRTLTSLQKLNVSRNVIKTVDFDIFAKANDLKVVDLSNNLIKTPIKNIMFAENHKLVYLNLYNNSISTIEDNSFKNTSLEFINFEKNNISGVIGKDLFAGLEKADAKSMNLSYLNITAIKEFSFSKLTSLTSLDVSNNNISIVEQNSFGVALKILDLSCNKVSNLKFVFVGLANLTELYLKNNSIRIVEKNAFVNNIMLITLDLTDNNIVDIQQNSLPLKKIQYLQLSGNNVSGVIRNNTFSGAKYLRFLNLSCLNITEVDDLAFVDLPVLSRLNLSHNKIESFKTNNFKGVDNLFSLDISSNYLKKIVFNNTHSILRAMHLNNNNLSNISEIFPGKSGNYLIYLDMSYNNISDLANVNSVRFPNLTVLRVSNNNIANFNNEDTQSLVKLVDLDLRSNKLTNIGLKYFVNLLTLKLSDNNLTYIDETVFGNISNVLVVDLSRNNISTLKPGTFVNMKNLKRLDLSSNKLTELRYGSFRGLQQTEYLDLSRNKISSLNADVFHECLKLESLILDYNHIATFDVQELLDHYLINLKKMSLGGNPISCHEVNLNMRAGRRKLVEVTSLDKIYHEDNVHGIKCGKDLVSTTVSTTVAVVEPADPQSSWLSTSTITLIWCCIVTLLLIIVIIFVLIKVKGVSYYLNRLRNPSINDSQIEMNGSEYHNNLLN